MRRSGAIGGWLLAATAATTSSTAATPCVRSVERAAASLATQPFLSCPETAPRQWTWPLARISAHNRRYLGRVRQRQAGPVPAEVDAGGAVRDVANGAGVQVRAGAVRALALPRRQQGAVHAPDEQREEGGLGKEQDVGFPGRGPDPYVLLQEGHELGGQQPRARLEGSSLRHRDPGVLARHGVSHREAGSLTPRDAAGPSTTPE